MAADPEEEEHIPVNMLNRVDLPDNTMGIMKYHLELKFVATTLTGGHVKSIDFDAFTLMIVFATYALKVFNFLALRSDFVDCLTNFMLDPGE